MSVASRPVSTGKTRTCPHCKATILESLSICPGCMHHLRFDSEAAKRQVAAAPALRVEGIIRHPPLEQPLEYFVIIAIRNDRGEEVTRQVVNVGALQAAEKRTFTLSVEVLPPQAPVPTKSTAATGTFKSPAPQPAMAKPSTPAASATAPAAPIASATSPPSATSTPSAGPSAGGATTVSPPPGAPSAARAPGSSAAQAPPAQGASSRGVAPSNSGPNTNPPGSNTARAPGPNTAKPPAGTAGPTTPPPAPGTGAANPTKPTPTSGYVLKPPSPGGPKRH